MSRLKHLAKQFPALERLIAASVTRQRDVHGAFVDAEIEAQRQAEVHAAFEAKKKRERAEKRKARERIRKHRKKMEKSNAEKSMQGGMGRKRVRRSTVEE